MKRVITASSNGIDTANSLVQGIYESVRNLAGLYDSEELSAEETDEYLETIKIFISDKQKNIYRNKLGIY